MGKRTGRMPKLHIKTYGCQMNVYDSGRMADLLAPHGYTQTDAIEEADLVILNTCHIRERAAEKVYSDLGRIRKLKAEMGPKGEGMLVAVAGCVAQAEAEEIPARMPIVDIVVGPQAYHMLPELLAHRARKAGTVLNTDFSQDDKFDHLPAEVSVDGVSAFLTVQEGCDKFCTFCVVPYTRGAEVSRPVAQIAAEAERLAAAGAREITLLGQNVNAYHGAGLDGQEWGLGGLVRHLARVPGVDRLRYTTSHPRDMDDDLIAAHGDEPGLMPYLHLPVQSGSDRVLKAMNRGHTADDYRRLVERIRAVRPDIALSSDFIVGFPGETDEDFAATLALIEDVGFAASFTFKYSRRPGTPGAAMTGHVREDLKGERLAVLQELIERQQKTFNAACVGRTLPVLVEKPGRWAGQVTGKSPYLQPVHFAGDAGLIGRIVEVEIEAAVSNSLSGRITGSRQAA